jgi:hypothetical protein
MGYDQPFEGGDGHAIGILDQQHRIAQESIVANTGSSRRVNVQTGVGAADKWFLV